MKAPVSTYRIQVRPSFDLDAVADVAGYLHELGADWVYLSPILEAESGSVSGSVCAQSTSIERPSSVNVSPADFGSLSADLPAVSITTSHIWFVRGGMRNSASSGSAL